MGIKGLWKIVEPAAIERSLVNLVTIEGFERSQGRRSWIIGVDTSLWIDNCQAAFQGATIHTHSGENPELRTFFFKLCRYLKMPVVLVFVLDGPGRPSVKRGRGVQPVPLWITSYLEELVDAFGFFVHQAPGEAEAELARLNSLGIIDAIFTDDSDTLVFGGECIIRRSLLSFQLFLLSFMGKLALFSRPWKSTESDHVILYTADSIEYSNGVKLTRGGLLLFALLAGGDYDAGIEGCGGNTARALAECSFGDELLDAATSLSGTNLQQFLHAWRKRLQTELRYNSQGRLRCRNAGVAQKITDKFPDLAVMEKYVTPLTSWSSQQGCQIPNTAGWGAREPSISKITAFCLQRFGWDRDGAVMKRFRMNLWPGVAFRMLCSVMSSSLSLAVC
ncbi:Flap endonuclease GEN 1 [Hypsizygus marmoreus]|uniref:Flap endonuclease GEN 1 n=1 Tax=Hypsizygus marmoreus TaxID=39966 RepID=A0A369K5S3_HYPMA|nr:Flap endonuclease GEN 1 [Hypsizygus marmoreus]